MALSKVQDEMMESYEVDLLLVGGGGGGGGGNSYGAGGGGAGGLLKPKFKITPNTSYSISIGQGGSGTGGGTTGIAGGAGGDTIAFGMTAIGGGCSVPRSEFHLIIQ